MNDELVGLIMILQLDTATKWRCVKILDDPPSMALLTNGLFDFRRALPMDHGLSDGLTDRPSRRDA